LEIAEIDRRRSDYTSTCFFFSSPGLGPSRAGSAVTRAKIDLKTVSPLFPLLPPSFYVLGFAQRRESMTVFFFFPFSPPPFSFVVDDNCSTRHAFGMVKAVQSDFPLLFFFPPSPSVDIRGRERG